MTDPRRIWIAAACLLTLFVSSGCTSGGHSGQPTGSGSSGSGRGPKAHATESAPPGDIPDTQAFVAYAAPDHAFSVRVPEGWAMTRVGQVMLFSDKYNSIRIESHPAAARPTIESANATDVPTIKAAASGYTAGTVKIVQRKSAPAVLITYRADSPPNPVTGKVAVEDVERYQFWRGGTEVVVTLSAPVGSDNVDPWRIVTDSFEWTR